MTIILENYRQGDELDMVVADIVVHVHTPASNATLRGTVHLRRDGGDWTLYGRHPFHPPTFRLDARRLLGEDGYDALFEVQPDADTCDALWPPARADRKAYEQHLTDEHLARLEDRYGP